MPKRGRENEREDLKAEEDDKDVKVLLGWCRRNLLAYSGSFVMWSDECGPEPRQQEVSCEVEPAQAFS